MLLLLAGLMIPYSAFLASHTCAPGNSIQQCAAVSINSISLSHSIFKLISAYPDNHFNQLFTWVFTNNQILTKVNADNLKDGELTHRVNKYSRKLKINFHKTNNPGLINKIICRDVYKPAKNKKVPAITVALLPQSQNVQECDASGDATASLSLAQKIA